MEFAIGLVVGLVVGVVLMLVLTGLRKQAARREMGEIQQQMRDAFDSLAVAALDANTQRLGEKAAGMLDSKKQLIDQSIQHINKRLAELSEYFHTVEKDRKEQFGRLSGSIGSLATTTGELHKILGSTQRRGAWGERMAEDVLRLAGLAEGVNYIKQSADASEEDRATRPDFTFLLPNDLKANMDVKFPLENYKVYLDAETDDARAAGLLQLIRDVRNHIGAVAKRGYVDTKGGTVPYVLVFIPSEQIFSLVLESQPDLIDEALGRKVVLASPLTLYAMLSVIRQAAENANIMKTADEVITILSEFNKQWINYNIELDALGKRLEQASEQYQKVSTTRTNVLQRQMDKIEDLRQQRSLPDE